MIDFGPRQKPITEDLIREMVNWRPRRIQLSSDWQNALHPPTSKFKNWSLVLPFPETFHNTFHTMCFDVDHRAHVSEENRCCIFLNRSKEDEGDSVRKAKRWIKVVEKYVGIRDGLALSFALDFRTKEGNPQKPRTRVGDLCRRAKLYEGSSRHDKGAADELVGKCVDFLKEMTCYDSADCVVAMPPSRPNKPFD